MSMEKSTTYSLCPLCGSDHAPHLVEQEAITIVKGVEISYRETLLVCENSTEESDACETASLANKNLLAARDAYRARMHLLTSSEIIALRKKYGLTQAELAKVLGWGEVTITRYETKAIQDEAHDSLLRIIRDNPMELNRLLDRNKDALSEERFQALKERIGQIMKEQGNAALRSQAVQSAYLPFSRPSCFNGNTPFDEQKFTAVVCYLASHVDHLYKTRLMKMLWYADSIAYRDYGKAITGAVYQHMPMGALPIAHNELLALNGIEVSEEEREDGSTQYLLRAGNQDAIKLLSKEERSVLDEVIRRFKYSSAQAIVDYMHRERAYLETSPGELISFEYARDLR